MKYLNPETGEVIEWTGTDWVSVMNKEEVPMWKGALRKAASGVTFDFADELEAAVGHNLTGETYEQYRDDVRGQNVAFGRQHPFVAPATEFAGGVAGPGAIATKLVGAGVGALGRIGRMTGVGLAEGVVTGAGQAESWDDLPTQAGLMGVFGAVLGGGLPVIGALGRAVRTRTSSMFRPKSKATRKIREELEQRYGSKEAAEVEMSKLGNEGILADLVPDVTRGVSTQPGASLLRAEKILKPRQQAAFKRIARQAQKATGKTATMLKQLEDLTKARAEKAGRLYRQIENIEIAPDKDLMFALTTKSGQSAAIRAKEAVYSRHRKEIDLESFPSDMRFWDEWYKDMRGQVEDAMTRPRGVPQAGAIEAVLQPAKGVLDRQTGGLYAAAREAYQKPSMIMDAMEQGRKDFASTVSTSEMVERRVNAMTNDERMGYLVGMVEGVKRQLKRGPDEAAKARRLLRYPETRDKIKAVFPDKGTFDEFMAFLEAETKMAETYGNVFVGSRTTPLASAQANLSSGGRIAQDVMSGNFGQAAQGALKAMAQQSNPKAVPPQVNEELARYLYQQGVPQNVGLLGDVFSPGVVPPWLAPGFMGGLLQTPEFNTSR